MIGEDFYRKPYVFSEFKTSVILPEWNLSHGTSDGKEYRPDPAKNSYFEISDIGRCIRVEDMSEYDDWPAVVRPKTEFCVLYIWDDYKRKNVPHFIDGTVEEVEQVINKALERYHKDKEIWEEIYKKAKLEFYEKIEAKA